MADIAKTITLRELVSHPIRIPNPLTSLSAAEVGGDLRISYVDNDTVATHYDIEASETNNFAAPDATVTIPATPLAGGFYDWSGLVINTAVTNYLRIKSRNTSGSSVWVNFTYTP